MLNCYVSVVSDSWSCSAALVPPHRWTQTLQGHETGHGDGNAQTSNTDETSSENQANRKGGEVLKSSPHLDQRFVFMNDDASSLPSTSTISWDGSLLSPTFHSRGNRPCCWFVGCFYFLLRCEDPFSHRVSQPEYV